MIRTLIAALAAMLVAAPAWADHKSEYKAYMTAFEAGDVAGAMAHGEAAWRAAESELGDHKTTAILAYNYATLAYEYQPAKALEAFERALAITEKVGGGLSATEIKLRIATLRTALELDENDYVAALEELLLGQGAEAGVEPQAAGWRTLAMHKMRRSDYSAAKDAADRAVALATSLQPEFQRLLAESLVIAGASRIVGANRTEQDVIEAVALFHVSFAQFPPQKDIDHFDPLLAQAMSWRQSVTALAESYGSRPRIRTGSRIPTGEDLKSAYDRARGKSGPDDWFTWESPRPLFCESVLEWSERKPPRYPTRALNRGNIGAAIVGFDLNDAGVERSVLLADFAEVGFGEAALQSMQKWRLKSPPPEACRKNRITFFIFVING